MGSNGICLCLVIVLLSTSLLFNLSKGTEPLHVDSHGNRAQSDTHRHDVQLLFPKEFHQFIRDHIITPFQWQRREGRHFAVLFLVAEKDLKDIGKTEFYPRDESGNVLVNSLYRMYPKPERYGNYIAARPQWLPSGMAIHTETMLLEQLPHLWNAFITRRLDANNESDSSRTNVEDHYPSYIILYTYLMPCSNCTDAIIDTFTKHPYNAVQCVVAYTEYWWRESMENVKRNKKRLKENGVSVVNVVYPRRIDEL